MTTCYDVSLYKEDLMMIEKWYIKYYGLKDVEAPDEEKDLFDKIVVLRKNEEYLENAERYQDGV